MRNVMQYDNTNKIPFHLSVGSLLLKDVLEIVAAELTFTLGED